MREGGAGSIYLRGTHHGFRTPRGEFPVHEAGVGGGESRFRGRAGRNLDTSPAPGPGRRPGRRRRPAVPPVHRGSPALPRRLAELPRERHAPRPATPARWWSPPWRSTGSWSLRSPCCSTWPTCSTGLTRSSRASRGRVSSGRSVERDPRGPRPPRLGCLDAPRFRGRQASVTSSRRGSCRARSPTATCTIEPGASWAVSP